jgi:tetratricopeptide (TPR) repeat protein
LRIDSTVISAIVGVLSICGFGTADDLADQANKISALEKEGLLPQALAVLSHLVADLQQRDPANELLPEAFDRKASIEADMGRYREAEQDYAKAIGLWKNLHKSASAAFATELNNLSSLYSVTGRLRQAETSRRESLALRLELLGPDSLEVALSYSNLAVDLFREGQYRESVELCHKALAIWSTSDSEHNRSDLAYHTLASIELKSGDFRSALSHALAAVAQYRTNQNSTASTMATYQDTVALAREANGDLTRAAQDFASAIAHLESSEQKRPSLSHIGLLIDYAKLLTWQKQGREAKRLLREAKSEETTIAHANQWQHAVDVTALLTRTQR